MDKATLDSFLAIQGVTGIALLGRKTRPYFYRSFQNLDKRQQEALTQGLFQVLESMPSGFDYFDFQFAEQRVFVYPLQDEWVLLVAVDETLILSTYSLAVNQLRQELIRDTERGLATFRLFVRQMETGSGTSTQPNLFGAIETSPSPSPPISTPQLREPQIQEVVQALNRLSQVTTTYLGKAVIVNYWKAARQELIDQQPGTAALLMDFEVERTAEIRYGGSLDHVTTSQLHIIRSWVRMFIRRCEDVIRNFRSLIKSGDVSQADCELLL